MLHTLVLYIRWVLCAFATVSSTSRLAPSLSGCPCTSHAMCPSLSLCMGVFHIAVPVCSPYALHALLMVGVLQLELGRNRCRNKRMEVWPRAVDTTLFNPAFRCESMRQRMTDGHPDATVLVYVGRLGAGLQLTLALPLLL